MIRLRKTNVDPYFGDSLRQDFRLFALMAGLLTYFFCYILLKLSLEALYRTSSHLWNTFGSLWNEVNRLDGVGSGVENCRCDFFKKGKGKGEKGKKEKRHTQAFEIYTTDMIITRSTYKTWGENPIRPLKTANGGKISSAKTESCVTRSAPRRPEAWVWHHRQTCPYKGRWPRLNVGLLYSA